MKEELLEKQERGGMKIFGVILPSLPKLLLNLV